MGNLLTLLAWRCTDPLTLGRIDRASLLTKIPTILLSRSSERPMSPPNQGHCSDSAFRRRNVQFLLTQDGALGKSYRYRLETAAGAALGRKHLAFPSVPETETGFLKACSEQFAALDVHGWDDPSTPRGPRGPWHATV